MFTFWLVGRIDYAKLIPAAGKVWRNPAVWGLIVAIGMCALVLVPIPGVTKAVNGARRWILLGPVQVQPSELAKWATVLFLAWWLSARPLNLDKFWTGFVPTLIPVGVLCLLIVIQDFGTAALIGLCALTMLMAGRAKGWHLAVVIPPALVAAFAFVRSEPYRWTRMTAFLDPWANPEGEGYHMVQSLLSFSTGGLFGRGLGNGVQKLGYLPGRHDRLHLRRHLRRARHLRRPADDPAVPRHRVRRLASRPAEARRLRPPARVRHRRRCSACRPPSTWRWRR